MISTLNNQTKSINSFSVNSSADNKTLQNKKNCTSPLVNKAIKTIGQHKMFSSEDALLVGVSGGPDSVALLLFLKDIESLEFDFFRISRSDLKIDSDSPSTSHNTIRIGIAHINHCLRGEESDRDEAFVAECAAKYNIPFYRLRIDVPAVAIKNRQSFEEAARDVRYQFYEEIMQKEGYTKTALGHNSDDNAELVLMNLLRGSGTKGLSGIPPVRDNKIIRPLIQVSRQEILDYLKLKNHPYMTDSSNADTSYLRNRIRHSLVPHLQEHYNPSVTDCLNRLSSIIMDDNSWMEDETARIFRSALLHKKEFEIQLDRRSFHTIHPALAKRVVRLAIERVKGDLKRITLRHIDDIIDLVFSTGSGTTLHLPGRIRIIKKKQIIFFRKESRPLRDIG